MRVRERRPVVEAIQWFKPGDHPSVVGQPTPGCGCNIIGGPGFRPHIHVGRQGNGYLVDPGDWVIGSEDGGFVVLSDEEFRKNYEEIGGSNER